MSLKTASLVVALLGLTACHDRAANPAGPSNSPPIAQSELTWESFYREPWPDPLHDKYQELFNAPFPGAGTQHFALVRPFSDVQQYNHAFDATASPGDISETESGGGEHAVSLKLAGSAGKAVDIVAGRGRILLSLRPPEAPRGYRVYRADSRSLPMPRGADPDTLRVARDGDWVRLKFNSLAGNPTTGAR